MPKTFKNYSLFFFLLLFFLKETLVGMIENRKEGRLSPKEMKIEGRENNFLLWCLAYK